jgi:hypothetical protein
MTLGFLNLYLLMPPLDVELLDERELLLEKLPDELREELLRLDENPPPLLEPVERDLDGEEYDFGEE